MDHQVDGHLNGLYGNLMKWRPEKVKSNYEVFYRPGLAEQVLDAI